MKVLKQQIGRLYYTHGLFCASHPFIILVAVCLVILITCYPLLNLPLPGNVPLEYSTYKGNYSVPSRVYSSEDPSEESKRPRWYVGAPVGYIQQIVVKAAVSPWQQSQMIGVDSVRSPLANVFQVLKVLEDFQHKTREGVETLEEVCLRVSEPLVLAALKTFLPQYSCFVVSPANLWHQDIKRFTKDADIIHTIFSQYGQSMQTPPSFKDLLFGVPWRETGIPRYFYRRDQRVISYAVTVVLKKYDAKFIDSLRERLEAAFPDTASSVNNSEITTLVHVHYKDFNYIVEYTPLFVTYVVLLLYIYFSVRKIEMVKSQLGLAVSAVVTVVSSLLMSLSLCYFFGLNPTLNGSEIFPYLVMIVGLENVLVITKSVVSTPVHLEVKIRVAQGLSREGWYITKNLCTELFIIFIGFFTFVPAIQEFCLFALVGLCTDFFLQMFFFATILSVDIRRMELADLHRQSVQAASLQAAQGSCVEAASLTPFISCPFRTSFSPPPPGGSSVAPLAPPPVGTCLAPLSPPPALSRTLPPVVDNWQPMAKIYRSKSAPRLDLPADHFGQVDPVPQDDFLQKMPRRLKFFYFWARTRMFQRLIMVCTVIWIGLIVYKTGLVDHIATNLEDVSLSSSSHSAHPQSSSSSNSDLAASERSGDEATASASGSGWWRWGQGDDSSRPGLLEHTQLEGWRQLSHKFWPRLFAFYNISLPGRYVSILPSIHLSAKIDMHTVVQMRHPNEEEQVKVMLQSRAADSTRSGPASSSQAQQQKLWSDALPAYMTEARLNAFYPKSRKETLITVWLCILSVIVISYFLVWLYKCMCSRNYSRWRHSWARHYSRRQRDRLSHYRQIKESLPLPLRGHSQEVECVAVDGQLVISACLSGQLCVFDSNTGECLKSIHRRSITPPRCRRPCLGRNVDDSDADLYAEFHGGKLTPESTSSSEGSFLSMPRCLERRPDRSRPSVERSQETVSPARLPTISTDFNSLTERPDHTVPSPVHGFDFQGWFEDVDEDNLYLRRTASPAQGEGMEFVGDWNYSSSPSDQHVPDESALGAISGDQLPMEDLDTHPASTIWSLTAKDGLVVVGCGNGRVEMWEAETGKLKYQYNSSTSPVSALCFVNNMVIVGRMEGTLDFLELETFHNPLSMPQSSPMIRPHRGHTRQYSLGNVRPQRLWEDTLRCHNLASLRAHQLPVYCLLTEGERVVTASDDHTLKVFRLRDQLCLYTLYGHEAGVRALCLDKCPPYAAASGALDGSVRLWDLMTGSCTHKFKWHERAVLQLATSLQFLVSLGQDDLVCVWERTRARLLHKIAVEGVGGSIMLMLHNLGILGLQGKLQLWDVSRGELVRTVLLPEGEQAFVRNIELVGANKLVCTVGKLLSVITFPITLDKAE